MIKTFEEYGSQTYENISKTEYKTLLKGDSGWGFDEEQVKKLVVDLQASDLNPIKSLGFDVVLVSIDDDIKSHRAVLYVDSVIPKFIITKVLDEYYLVDSLSNGRREVNHSYWKCDQTDGLISYLEDFKNHD